MLNYADETPFPELDKQARREERGSEGFSPWARSSKDAQGPQGLIFYLIFALYRIKCVNDNIIFALKYLIPQTSITIKTQFFS